MRDEQRGRLRTVGFPAAFAAVAVSVQPLLWNVLLLVAGLPDVVLVGWAAATTWWGGQPAVFPHVVAAVLLCGAATLSGRLMFRRSRPWLPQLACAALAGLTLSAVLTHWYVDSVGGSETMGQVIQSFAVFAVLSIPWIWMAHLLAEPRALSGARPVPAG
jgi:hypothetical protein